MNGYDIYKKAVARLGYENGDEITLKNTQFSHIFEIINQITADLKLDKLSELSQEIDYSADIIEAICCGAAMLISLSEGDIAKNQIFTNIYNAKRAAILGGISHIKDTLPVAESGE